MRRSHYILWRRFSNETTDSGTATAGSQGKICLTGNVIVKQKNSYFGVMDSEGVREFDGYSVGIARTQRG
jgi:hypothetical protein